MCVLLAAAVSVVPSPSYGMDLKQLTATQNVVWKQVIIFLSLLSLNVAHDDNG